MLKESRKSSSNYGNVAFCGVALVTEVGWQLSFVSTYDRFVNLFLAFTPKRRRDLVKINIPRLTTSKAADWLNQTKELSRTTKAVCTVKSVVPPRTNNFRRVLIYLVEFPGVSRK